nr:MAG TPA: hypothetical protein [Caudoviricetes sp.]
MAHNNTNSVIGTHYEGRGEKCIYKTNIFLHIVHRVI